jgi:hypothetical protein
MATSIVQAALSLMLVGSAWAASDVRYAAVLDKRATGPVVPSALPEKWSYQGCYTDPGPRTLDAASYTNNTGMTDETCISYCNTLGYIYAGTEYASQCCRSTWQFLGSGWMLTSREIDCDNQIASTGAPATDGRCSMSCTGNSTEVCGGPIGLTLFWSGVPPPAGPSANPGTSGFGFYGCYT